MKNHPQDGANRRDRQQQQEPRREERQDLSQKPGIRREDQRQGETRREERRDLTQKPNEQRGVQDPSRRERQDEGGKQQQGRQEYMGGKKDERQKDRTNVDQKFPAGKDRPDTERSAAGKDPQRRQNDDVNEPRDPEQEPYMGRKHEE